MGWPFRRQVIRDELIQTRGIGLRSIRTIQHGTRVGAFAGTVSFPRSFVGTPAVVLTPIGRGQVNTGGTVRPVRTVNRYSGSFTFAGSPRVGTLQWLAIGSSS